MDGGLVKYVGPLPTTPPSAPAATPVVVTPEPAAVGVPGNPDGSCPESAPIKVSRSGLYHRPSGDPNDAATKARLCFSTPQAAEQVGYRAPKR